MSVSEKLAILVSIIGYATTNCGIQECFQYAGITVS